MKRIIFRASGRHALRRPFVFLIGGLTLSASAFPCGAKGASSDLAAPVLLGNLQNGFQIGMFGDQSEDTRADLNEERVSCYATIADKAYDAIKTLKNTCATSTVSKDTRNGMGHWTLQSQLWVSGLTEVTRHFRTRTDARNEIKSHGNTDLQPGNHKSIVLKRGRCDSQVPRSFLENHMPSAKMDNGTSHSGAHFRVRRHRRSFRSGTVDRLQDTRDSGAAEQVSPTSQRLCCVADPEFQGQVDIL